jgi:hypothetical protein
MLQRNAKPHDLIAMNLRVALSDVVMEPLPERIRRLLKQLVDQEIEQERGSGETRTNARKRPHK